MSDALQSDPSPAYREMFESLQRRRRPEDIAQLLLEAPEMSFSRETASRVRAVATGSLKRGEFAYTSMSEDFATPVGCQKQLRKGQELFVGIDGPFGAGAEDADRFLYDAAPRIGMQVGRDDFQKDRMNQAARSKAGLELSKRQYNKRFRFLRRLHRKRDQLAREWEKRACTLISRSRLASLVTAEDFFANPASAAFISYYTARCNLRSAFTIDGQQRPYDELCDALLGECRVAGSAVPWRAVACAFPDPEVLSQLSDEEKGWLLGKWFETLGRISEILRETWVRSEINRATMIVRRGNDSTTWNIMAGAWNKARDSWFKLLFSLGLEELIEPMCPGKVLRLMAADVAAWHRSAGNTLEEDTKVWSALPMPWEVLSGHARCSLAFVKEVCKYAGVDPVKKGWIAPPPDRHVAQFRPTPELVHGVEIGHPGLALFLRKARFFSGKPAHLHLG